MKRKTSVLRGLNDIRESYILESEIPAANAAWANAESKPTPKETWRRVVSSGWFAAAVCAVVAFGTLGGIIMAGHLAADPTPNPPAGTVVPNNTIMNETETEPEQTVVDIRVLHKKIYYGTDRDEQLRYEYTYSSRGNLASETFYRNGTEESQKIYTYNEQNLKTTLEYIVYNPANASMTYTYAYDEENRLIKECRYDNINRLVYVTTSEYDAKGRLEKFETTNAIITRTYGEHDSYVELTVNKKSGKVSKTEVTQDEYGNILRECYYTDEIITYEKRCEYNEKRQKTKELTYDNGELGIYWVYEYENDRLITLYSYLDNELSSYITHEYNEFGELIRQETRDPDDNLTSSIVWEYGGIVDPQ